MPLYVLKDYDQRTKINLLLHTSYGYDKIKQRIINSWKNTWNKLREGYKRFRPERVRNLPRIKYIARNKPFESAPSAMKGSQDRGGEIYGNLDNLGITYDKTNERLLYSVNRKNSPLFRFKKTKRKLSSDARKDNSEETRSDLERASDLDESPPANRFPWEDIENRVKMANSENPFDSKLQDESVNEVSRNVELFEDTPKSAASYPHTKESLVYGNLDNLGITYGKTNERVMYSPNRRNTVLETLLKLLAQPSYSRERRHKTPLVRHAYSDDFHVLPVLPITRRKNNESDSDSSVETDSSEFEFNAQNPYTVHKNRYIQNYLWHHKMTGDHMNVNPYAPRFISSGATAPELFYSRKWWYFNQDDFVPFG